MDMDCVFCEVGTDIFYVYYLNRVLAMTQAVSRRSLAVESGVVPQADAWRYAVHKTAAAQVFLRVILFFPSQNHSTNSLHFSSCTCYLYQNDKRAKPGNFSKSSALLENGNMA